jgi:hypothetical protein
MALTKEEKKALREKLTMKQKKGETLWRKPGELDGKAFAINDLEDCIVYILDHTSQVSRFTPKFEILEIGFCELLNIF